MLPQEPANIGKEEKKDVSVSTDFTVDCLSYILFVEYNWGYSIAKTSLDPSIAIMDQKRVVSLQYKFKAHLSIYAGTS